MLERDLESFIEMQPLERMRSELTAVRTSLGKLQEMVLGTGFIQVFMITIMKD